MNPETIKPIIIAIPAISMMIMLVASMITYQVSINMLRKDDKEEGKNIHYDSVGTWFGSTYMAKIPLPIIRESNNPKTMKIVRIHNRFVKYFWLSGGLMLLATFVTPFIK